MSRREEQIQDNFFERIRQQILEEQRLEEERREQDSREFQVRNGERYTVEERVEARLPRTIEWRPATITRVGHLVVRNNASGREMDRQERGVRDPATQQTGETANLRVSHPVEIQMARNNWVPGILISKNYSVRFDDADNIVPLTSKDIRRPQGQAPAVRQPQVQPIKTIEVPEELKFYSVLELDNISKDECNGIAVVLQTDSGEYITGCVSIDEIKLVNRNKPTTLGNNYMRLEIQGGLYDVKNPNWVRNINSLTIDMVPEPRIFYLEKDEVIRGVQTYKLVQLNIIVKPPVPLEQAEVPVMEERAKPKLEEPPNNRSKKSGGKNNKRGKNTTNKKSGGKSNKKRTNKKVSKSKKVRR